MLTVRNPSERTLSGWFRDNHDLLAGLILWAAVLLCIAGAVPRLSESAWYNVSFVEGGLMYDRMPDEAACRAGAVNNASTCFSGAELNAGDSSISNHGGWCAD